MPPLIVSIKRQCAANGFSPPTQSPLFWMRAFDFPQLIRGRLRPRFRWSGAIDIFGCVRHDFVANSLVGPWGAIINGAAATMSLAAINMQSHASLARLFVLGQIHSLKKPIYNGAAVVFVCQITLTRKLVNRTCCSAREAKKFASICFSQAHANREISLHLVELLIKGKIQQYRRINKLNNAKNVKIHRTQRKKYFF